MHLAVSQIGSAAREETALLASQLQHLCSLNQPAAWSAQYLAFTKLLCAVDLVKKKDPAASKALAKQAKEALSILRLAVSNTILEPEFDEATKPRSAQVIKNGLSSVNPKRQTTSTHTRANARQLESTRKPLSPRSAAASSMNHNVTPPRKTNRNVEGASALDRKPQKLLSKLENPRESLALLATVTSMLGFFEHTFLRLGYLRLLKHLYDGFSDDAFVRTCLELVTEYQYLGQTARAEAILSQAREKAANAGIRGESRVLLSLQEAEALAYQGEPDKG